MTAMPDIPSFLDRRGGDEPIIAPRGYHEFLTAKIAMAQQDGIAIDASALNAWLKPHAAAAVQWALAGGRRAIFASFGLAKTSMQLEAMAQCHVLLGGPTLIVHPLGVRQEFYRDAQAMGISVKFIRGPEEIDPTIQVHLANYETVRDGKLDPALFCGASLDEASVLRGFGGTKTFREFMRMFEPVPYRFVATATPSPNEYIEILAYAAFLGIMDVGQAKTRFFKRNSEEADNLTIHPHKEQEFWLWVASWALFIQQPSDLGFSDEGYDLRELRIHWHEVASDHAQAGTDREGQGLMFKDSAIGLQDAAREKRETIEPRVAKLAEIARGRDGAQLVAWCDLNAEQDAIERAFAETGESITSLRGSQDIDERETLLAQWRAKETAVFLSKPQMYGAGINMQQCHTMIFVGIGFKFQDIIQAVHREYRFQQLHDVDVHFIHTEAERQIKAQLLEKWKRHDEQAAKMQEIVRHYGLSQLALASSLTRSFGVARREISGEHFSCINNDCVLETARMPENSAGMIITSIPFATQYEYTPSYNDFGHTDDDAHFWRQMDFLVPQLLKVLQPGRVAAIHVKDRIVPGGMTGLGFQTVSPFHADCIAKFREHGFAYMGMKTITTDVVRENNQTYRLGWSEQCKDGTRMGPGMPEYLLMFRKPPTDASNGYADKPVMKEKPFCDDRGVAAPFDKRTNWKRPIPGSGYTRARWQMDAHGYMRSSGERLLTPEETGELAHDTLYKLWKERSQFEIYDFAAHVGIAENMDRQERLPATFMLLPPHSWHPDVWSDVARMRTLNGSQERKGQEMHLCLARGSRVLTRGGGYVPIEAVAVGDEVLTHKGRWRRVTVARCTGVQSVVTLTGQGISGLTLTPDHKLWTRKPRRVRQREGAEYIEPAWVEAQHTIGSYINCKLPDVEEPDIDDPSHWWIVGRWLADGHWEARGAAMISCGDHEVEDLIARLGDRAGGSYRTRTAWQIRVRDPDGSLKETLRRCGIGAEGKRLPPEAFTLPLALADALLAGYLSGDGHCHAGRHRWMVTAVGRELLLGVAMLAQRVHGAIASLYAGRPARTTQIQGRTVSCRQEWVLGFDLDSARRKRPFILDDGAWKRVRSIEDAGTAETWCLRVEEDESFTAEGCVVKNCPLQFDIVDRLIIQCTEPGETVLDPFGGLMTVPYRAVMHGRRGIGIELAPAYFADGVRYCQEAEAQRGVPSLFDLLAAEAPKKFETRLTDTEERQFHKWKATYAPGDSGDDYDLRGAFKAGLTPDSDGHWPDTFKKPNHPTFSVESVYARDCPENAGRWDGDRFVPAEAPREAAE